MVGPFSLDLKSVKPQAGNRRFNKIFWNESGRAFWALEPYPYNRALLKKQLQLPNGWGPGSREAAHRASKAMMMISDGYHCLSGRGGGLRFGESLRFLLCMVVMAAIRKLWSATVLWASFT